MARLIKTKQITAGADNYVLTSSGSTAFWSPLSGITGNVQELNDLSDVTTGLPVSPTAADDGKILFYDNNTNQWITDDTVTHGTSVVNSKKSTAGTIAIGTPVYLVGFDNDLHTVEAANAGSASTMPVIGLVAETLDATNSKHVMTFGKLQGVDLSTGSTINPNNEVWNIATDLYVSTTTGGLTMTRPTGAATQIQRIAHVLKTGTTDGQLLIFNTARAAGLPNLTTSSVWAGNASNQPAESGSVFAVDLANSKVGIGTTTPSEELEILGNEYVDGQSTGNPTLRVDGAGNSASANTDTSQYALQVRNSSAGPLFSVRNDGSALFVGGGGASSTLIRTDTTLTVRSETATSSSVATLIQDSNTNVILATRGDRRTALGTNFIFSDAVLTIGKPAGTTDAIRTTGGNVGFGAGSLFVPTAKLHIVGDGATSATDALTITNSASTTLLHVEDGGNVGIGTATPSANLDVVGTLQYVDGNEGSGKVLTSDANGNAVWSASTGGGGISKYALTTGFTGGVVLSIPHNLNTADIQVQIWDSSFCVVDGDICLNGADGLNKVDVTLSVTGSYKIVVIG